MNQSLDEPTDETFNCNSALAVLYNVFTVHLQCNLQWNYSHYNVFTVHLQCITMHLQCTCSATYNGTTVKLQSTCNQTAMKLQSNSNQTAINLQWNYSGTVMESITKSFRRRCHQLLIDSFF